MFLDLNVLEGRLNIAFLDSPNKQWRYRICIYRSKTSDLALKNINSGQKDKNKVRMIILEVKLEQDDLITA